MVEPEEHRRLRENVETCKATYQNEQNIDIRNEYYQLYVTACKRLEELNNKHRNIFF